MDPRFFLLGKEPIGHSKCHFQRLINRRRLRFQPRRIHYVKQNKIRTSHFWQRAEAPSDHQVLYSQKPGSTWMSLKKHLQSALKYKNLMCDSLCHGYKTKGSYKAAALVPHEGPFTYSIPQPSREHNFVLDKKMKEMCSILKGTAENKANVFV